MLKSQRDVTKFCQIINNSSTGHCPMAFKFDMLVKYASQWL